MNFNIFIHVDIPKQVNGTFKLTNFDAKEEDPKYRSPTGHEFELLLNNSTIIEALNGVDLPPIPFEFLDIKQVIEKPDKSTVGQSCSN